MDLLKQRILKDGTVLPGNVLKVDNFLNHQVDAQLMDQIGWSLPDCSKMKKLPKSLP